MRVVELEAMASTLQAQCRPGRGDSKDKAMSAGQELVLWCRCSQIGWTNLR